MKSENRSRRTIAIAQPRKVLSRKKMIFTTAISVPPDGITLPKTPHTALKTISPMMMFRRALGFSERINFLNASSPEFMFLRFTRSERISFALPSCRRDPGLEKFDGRGLLDVVGDEFVIIPG